MSLLCHIYSKLVSPDIFNVTYEIFHHMMQSITTIDKEWTPTDDDMHQNKTMRIWDGNVNICAEHIFP